MSRKLKVYLSILFILFLIFTYGALFYPHSSKLPSGGSLESPSATHFLGTDDLGVDVFSQLSKGFFLSMFIGLSTSTMSFFIGGILGFIAGYAGGKIDFFISFLINFFLSIPQLPIMIVIGAFFGQSLLNIVIIISLFSWAYIAKITRVKVLEIKNRDFIIISKSYGAGFYYIFKKYMFSEIVPIIIINSLSIIGKAIIQESSLAFLGLSDPTSRSWGLMIQKVINFPGIYFTEFWVWWLLPPLISLTLVTYCTRMICREAEEIILA